MLQFPNGKTKNRDTPASIPGSLSSVAQFLAKSVPQVHRGKCLPISFRKFNSSVLLGEKIQPIQSWKPAVKEKGNVETSKPLKSSSVFEPEACLNVLADLSLHYKPNPGEPKWPDSPPANDSACGTSSSLELSSPSPLYSFSPLDRQATLLLQKAQRLFLELVESELTFLTGIKLLLRYFVEPCLLRSFHLSITCTPLLTLNSVLIRLVERHEKLHSILQKCEVDTALEAIEQLFSRSNYSEYSGAVSFIVYLMHTKVAPFELLFPSQLGTFLEKAQPGQRRMDLSVLLLLQKPMTRIAKYPLFLSAMTQLDPANKKIIHCLETVCLELTRIDQQIEAETIKFDTVKSLNKNLGFESYVGRPAHFFGPITMCGKILVFTVDVTDCNTFEACASAASVFCQQNHLVITRSGSKAESIRFVLPFSQCELITNVRGCIHGLTTSAELTIKLLVNNQDFSYEILLVGLDDDTFGELGLALEAIATDCTLQARTSHGDLVIDPKTAIYDVRSTCTSTKRHSGTDRRCYFRQVYNVDVAEALQKLSKSPKMLKLPKLLKHFV